MLQMRACFRAAAVAALAAAAVCSVLAAPSPARAAIVRGTPTGLHWGACPPSAAGLPDFGQECAMVAVPLDYGHPAGRRITIAISRISARDPGVRHGILLVNPGGPGAPGLVEIPRLLEQGLPQAIADRYDIVGFDPRGVEYSSPVSCGLTPQQAAEASPPLMQPAGFGATVAFMRWVADRCAATSGALLPYITTANTARDMDAIRAALGEARLSYLGGSYGSYLGAVYASLFPGHTDRVILEASEGPHYVWRAAFRLWGLGGDIRFPDFAAFAAANEATYHLGATPQAVEQTYYRLLHKLDKNPLTVPNGIPYNGALFTVVNGTLFRALTFGFLSDDSYFPTLAADWQAVAESPAAAATRQPSAPALADDQVPTDNFKAAQMAVLCDDVEWPRSVAQYRFQLSADELLHPKFAELGSNIWPCAFWPYRPQEPPVTITPMGPRNVLIVENARDPLTPLPLALDMRASFGPRASLVVADAGGHDITNTCANQLVFGFLASGVLPGDRSCPADPPGTRAPTPPMNNPAGLVFGAG